MRINSATRSDVFNEYVKIISNFNLKHNKTAAAAKQSLEELLAAAKPILPELANANSVETALKALENNLPVFDATAILGRQANTNDLKQTIKVLKADTLYTKNNKVYLTHAAGRSKITNENLLPGLKKQFLEQENFNSATVNEFYKNLTEARGIEERFLSEEMKEVVKADAAKASEQGAAALPTETKVVKPAKVNGTTGDAPVPDPAEVFPQKSTATPSPSSPRAGNSAPIDELYNKVGIDKLKSMLESLLNEKDFIGFYTNIAMKSNSKNVNDMLNLVNAIKKNDGDLLNFTEQNSSIFKLCLNQNLDKDFIRSVMVNVPDRVISKEIGEFLTKIQKDGNNIKTLSDDFLKEIESRPAKYEIINNKSLGLKEDFLKRLNLTDLPIGSELIIPRSDGGETLATFLGFYEDKYPRFAWQEGEKQYFKHFKLESDIEKIKLPDGSPIRSALAEPTSPAAASTPAASSTPVAAPTAAPPTPATPTATPAIPTATPAIPTAPTPPTPPAPVVAANRASEALEAATREELNSSIATLRSEISSSAASMTTKFADLDGKLSSLEASLKAFKDTEIAKVSTELEALRSELRTLSTKATQPAAAPVVAEEAKGIFSRIKEVLSDRLITRLKGTPAAKAAEEAAATAGKSAKETEALAAAEKRVKEAEEALKAAKSATTKTAEVAATAQAAKSIGSALKTLAGVGLAVGATYAIYKAVTGEDMPDETVEPPSGIEPVETGVPGSSENPISPNNLSDISDSLSTPEGRANIQGQLNSLANSNLNSYNKLLSSMESIFGATGKYKLERPIRIKGERIEYVFPRQAAGSRNPLDPGRAKAAEEYMYKLLENKGRKASNIKGRILTDANSENPMEIANYMFSTIANKGLFKGLGTGRAGRYGRGAGIREIENKGFSGSQEERMTRKERRALRDISKNQFDQGDETPLSDNFDSSPMESFSSGYNELFEKYSSDLDNSINNSEIMKKADKTSKRYFKDAVKDLSSDSFMSDYYAGFSKLYDSKVKKKKSDYSKLYDVQEETGSDRIHKAHPEAIVVADAIGNGGLVENASESSKAMQDVASRMPTGNYRARYAFIQNALKKASS